MPVNICMDMPIYFTYAIQLLLIFHVIKTGRERYWILILLFLPLLGGAAYVILEIVPELMGGVGGQRALRGMQQLVDPGGDVRACQQAWEQSPNAENGRRLAQALITADKPDEALEVLEQARSGFFEDDPTLLLLEAQARFLREEWADSRRLLERLRSENPDFRSAEGHLLHARALQAEGKLDEAVESFSAVAGYFPGAEARYRLADALQQSGDVEAARDELENLLRDAKLAPAHYRKSQKAWLAAAKKSLASLSAPSA